MALLDSDKPIGGPTVTSKIISIVITIVLTLLATLAFNGVNAVSQADATKMINEAEAKHEAKIDIVIDRLTKIEVSQARLEEKVQELKDKK